MQSGNTFTFLHLNRSTPTNIVPSPLNIRWGLINKVISSLDLVASALHSYMDWVAYKNEVVAPYCNQSASNLASIGSKRKCYYSGKIAGVPCTVLIKGMNSFWIRFSPVLEYNPFIFTVIFGSVTSQDSPP